MADVKLIFVKRRGCRTSGSFYIGQSETPPERAASPHMRSSAMGGVKTLIASLNGTFLNGARVKTHLVKNGDVISLGQVLDIKVEIRVATGTRPATPKASSHLPMALIGVMAVILIGALVLVIAMRRPRTTAPPVPQPTLETPQSEEPTRASSSADVVRPGISGGPPNCESISNDQVELAAKQVLRRISIDKQDYAFPAGKPLDDLRSEVVRHCGQHRSQPRSQR
jgi:hypothetical protein